MIACFLVVLTSKVCECLRHLGAVHQEVALHVDHLQADVIVTEDEVLKKTFRSDHVRSVTIRQKDGRREGRGMLKYIWIVHLHFISYVSISAHFFPSSPFISPQPLQAIAV